MILSVIMINTTLIDFIQVNVVHALLSSSCDSQRKKQMDQNVAKSHHLVGRA